MATGVFGFVFGPLLEWAEQNDRRIQRWLVSFVNTYAERHPFFVLGAFIVFLFLQQMFFNELYMLYRLPLFTDAIRGFAAVLILALMIYANRQTLFDGDDDD